MTVYSLRSISDGEVID